jgi:hypothetical protein
LKAKIDPEESKTKQKVFGERELNKIKTKDVANLN